MEFDNTESKKFPLVDSHAHLDMPEFDPDRDQMIERSFAAGVSALLCPMEVTDPESIRKTRWITDRYPNIIAAAGVHPHSAKDFSAKSGRTIQNLAGQGGIHALGEIGLDFHYNFSSRDEQIHAFRKQLNLAQELDMPVIIHSRLASDEVLDAIRGEGYARGGVLHCFTESRGISESPGYPGNGAEPPARPHHGGDRLSLSRPGPLSRQGQTQRAGVCHRDSPVPGRAEATPPGGIVYPDNSEFHGLLWV